MRKFRIYLMLLLAFCFLLTGCAQSKTTKKEDNNGKLTVYTTVYPLQYFTERIGGDYVDVKTVYPPGADEHTFEPTQKDMMSIADSDLFVYIGFGLEGFVNSAKETLKNETVHFLAAGENVKLDNSTHKEEEHEDEHVNEDGHSHDDGHNHGDVDPHLWIDPIYSIDMVKAIEKELISLKPDHKEEFINNSKKLQDELTKLNSEFENVMDHAKHKEIIVSHAAFGYWEKRYHLEQISVAGLSTSNEPTQKQLKNLISTAKEHNIRYVFFEQNVSSKLTEIIQKEIGAKPLILHNLATLTAQDMNKNRDYFSIMKDNLRALETAIND